MATVRNKWAEENFGLKSHFQVFTMFDPGVQNMLHARITA